MIALLFHLALLFLWCRVWTRDDRAFFFNPLVSGPMRVVDRILGVLRIPLPFLPTQALAALALLGVLALKAFALSTIEWRTDGMSLGFLHGFQMELWAFLFFAIQIAAIHAILRVTSKQRATRAAQTVELLARPVSLIRPVAWQLLAASVAGIIACSLLAYFSLHFPNSLDSVFWTRMLDEWPLCIGLPFFVDILQVWSRCLLLAIVLSWIEIFKPRSPIASCAREFSSFLLGRLSGLLPVGMVDMTPLVVFVAVNHLHKWLDGMF